ncbi:MAG: hypothetical protein ABEI27_01225 [Halobellus sp.]|uniref:hypothetical protein n=1 Tax=Halobellus sp. TaxID=1979212 RepID=UPI0035D4D9F4
MSSSPSSPADNDATTAPGTGPPSSSLLVDRIAELERATERLEAKNVRLQHEVGRLERCLDRRRRERQDVIDRYERQLRQRTVELERATETTPEPESEPNAVGALRAAVGVVVERLRSVAKRIRS